MEMISDNSAATGHHVLPTVDATFSHRAAEKHLQTPEGLCFLPNMSAEAGTWVWVNFGSPWCHSSPLLVLE